jgi:hypothetical protein
VAGWNFGGDRTASYLQVFTNAQFLNYWTVTGSIVASARSVSDNLTRGGPVGISPAAVAAVAGLSSDFRKPIVTSLVGSYSRNDLAGWGTSLRATIEARPAPTIVIAIQPSLTVTRESQQYVRDQSDPAATATFGRQYVFAEVLRRTLDLTTRLSLTLTPSLSLQLYAQPFVGTGDYVRFKELTAARTTEYLVYGARPGSALQPVAGPGGSIVYYLADADGATGPRRSVLIPNPDFSYRSLRTSAVMRWEWRPGSTFFLVWTGNCSARLPDPAFTVVDDVRHLCRGHSDNVFGVKLNYWLSL